MDKKQLRHQLQGHLLEVSAADRSDKSKQACQNLIKTEQFQNASVVMLYLSLPHEVDTTSAILYAWQQEKTVAVPKISWQQRHMIAVAITSLESGLSTETGGLRNPTTGVPMPFEDIDLVVTPGLGFDKKGNRLGTGGGYYDRFFNSNNIRAAKCGIAFGQQIVSCIPTNSDDRGVDFVVTDEGVIDCK